MNFPNSLLQLGIEPITHANIKSYGNEYLLSLKAEMEENVRNTKREEWREAKYYAYVITMIKTEISHRNLKE